MQISRFMQLSCSIPEIDWLGFDSEPNHDAIAFLNPAAGYAKTRPLAANHVSAAGLDEHELAMVV